MEFLNEQELQEELERRRQRTKLSPSRVRDRCESRIRKFANTYSVEERLAAADELLAIVGEYRDQLVDQVAETFDEEGEPLVDALRGEAEAYEEEDDECG